MTEQLANVPMRRTKNKITNKMSNKWAGEKTAAPVPKKEVSGQKAGEVQSQP